MEFLTEFLKVVAGAAGLVGRRAYDTHQIPRSMLQLGHQDFLACLHATQIIDVG